MKHKRQADLSSPPRIFSAQTPACSNSRLSLPSGGMAAAIPAAALNARLAAEGSALRLHTPATRGDVKKCDVPALVAALVRSNWPRTVLWTARALLAAWMLRAGG